MLYCLFLPCRLVLHCVIRPDLGVLSVELGSEMPGEARESLFCRTSKLPILHLRLLMFIAWNARFMIERHFIYRLVYAGASGFTSASH